MTTANLFTQAVSEFAAAVADNFRQQVKAQPEDQLKPLVGDLIRRVGAAYVNGTIAYRTEVLPDDVDGRPDLGITVNTLLVGHVELKAPGIGARPERFRGTNRRQWQRFQALPNLIYTDGAEWSLYRSGELTYRVRISDDITVAGPLTLSPSLPYTEHLADLDTLLRDFMNWHPIVPATARGVAEFLAPLTRVLRDEVVADLDRVDSPLRNLANEWGRVLFPDADDAQFADAYAQTLTYALLLAKFEGAESLGPAVAVDALHGEHDLLAEALNLMEVRSVRERLLMPIELIERAISAIETIQFEQHSDHWLYFYEAFLGAYDPKLRKERGVYFTPVEVVRCQVRLAAELLQTRFGKPLAFAENSVTVLDPAVGTGTYPLAVIDHAADAVQNRFGPGQVSTRLGDLAGRLHAFELLVGPYAVAQLRISQRLRDEGVTNASANVYLTDTLESPNAPSEGTQTLLQEHMSLDRERAQQIKRDVPIVVCLGNPPYDREQRDPDEEGRRKGGWVRHGEDGSDEPALLDDFLKPASDAGAGVHLHNLYNDYVYFWRWALWKVFDSTDSGGIVTFITASSYLRGPGFVGMRRKMREVFDELWVIDLEGDSLGARKTDNVFAIRPPVAIAIGVRAGSPSPDTPATVHKVRLTGSERAELDTLDSVESFDDLAWRDCSSDWDASFYPSGRGTYFTWPAVTDVFPWQQSGVKVGRTWPISPSQNVLNERWKSLAAASRTRKADLFINRPTGRKVTDSLSGMGSAAGGHLSIDELASDAAVPSTVSYLYRSLNRQWLLADDRLIDRRSPPLWAVHGNKQVFMTSLLTEVFGLGPAAMATASIPDLHCFRGSFGGKHVIPLWRDADASVPNVTNGFVELISSVHDAAITAEHLFAYAYGILAQPTYVGQFWDELELPPPRLPITKDPDLFERVTKHGGCLIYLHTYGERFRGLNDDGSVPQGVARCTKAVSQDVYPADFEYDPSSRVVKVGDGEFAPVSPEVWAYSISGLEVVKSWLNYRKRDPSGKKSSPLDDIRPESWTFGEELLELLWVLEATIALEPKGAALLEEVCNSDLFTADELPTPTNRERRAPRPARAVLAQPELEVQPSVRD